MPTYTFNPTLPTLKDHARMALRMWSFTSEADAIAKAYFSNEMIEAKILAFGYLEGLAQLAEAALAGVSDKLIKWTEGDVSEQIADPNEYYRQLAKDARGGVIQAPYLASSTGQRYVVGQISTPDPTLRRFD